MRLIKKITIVCIILLVISIFTSAEVVALDCPPGKTGVTIVTPPGKVIEICVASAAIPYIGGPGDVVISAICPCWSAEYAADVNDCLICTGPCDCDNYCHDIVPDTDPYYLPYYLTQYSFLNSCGAYETSLSVKYHPTIPAERYCGVNVNGLGIYCDNYLVISDITEDQFRACRAILMSSELWSLCDGS